MTTEHKSVEDWLDNVCKVWESIEVGDGSKLKSFKVFERNELPSAPILAALAPCVATYVEDCQPDLSDSTNILHWQGISEFHLTKDVKPSNEAYVMLFYAKILVAAASNFYLAGLRDNGGHWTIPKNTAGVMQNSTFINLATNLPDHQGIVVRWVAHQNVGGSYPLGSS